MSRYGKWQLLGFESLLIDGCQMLNRSSQLCPAGMVEKSGFQYRSNFEILTAELNAFPVLKGELELHRLVLPYFI